MFSYNSHFRSVLRLLADKSLLKTLFYLFIYLFMDGVISRKHVCHISNQKKILKIYIFCKKEMNGIFILLFPLWHYLYNIFYPN